jgi:multimeric flavodoxin WrbA
MEKWPTINLHLSVQNMIEADLVILATPVYWYAMSGPMKDFVDRFSNLMSGPHKELGEALYGKRLKVFSTGHDSSLPLGFEVPFSATALYFGIDYLVFLQIYAVKSVATFLSLQTRPGLLGSCHL